MCIRDRPYTTAITELDSQKSAWLGGALAAGGWGEGHPVSIAFAITGMVVGLLGSVALCRLLRLYPLPAHAASKARIA